MYMYVSIYVVFSYGKGYVGGLDKWRSACGKDNATENGMIPHSGAINSILKLLPTAFASNIFKRNRIVTSLEYFSYLYFFNENCYKCKSNNSNKNVMRNPKFI